MPTDFNITASVRGLDRLEAILAKDEVSQVVQYTVVGGARLPSGVELNIVKMEPVIKLVAEPKRKAAGGDDEEPVVLGSDVEDDCEPVVDTEVESDAESEGSDASSADGIAEVKAELKAAPLRKFLHTAPVQQPLAKPKATGDPRKPTTVPLWSDEYFVVRHRPVDAAVQVRIKKAHCDSLCESTWPMSCQVVPRSFGEKPDDPVRSLLVLRGWMLWRARVDGWAQARNFRAKHFVEHEAHLERDVKSLKAQGGLLGNSAADAAFAVSSPAIVARLRAATAAASAAATAAATGGHAASGI